MSINIVCMLITANSNAEAWGTIQDYCQKLTSDAQLGSHQSHLINDQYLVTFFRDDIEGFNTHKKAVEAWFNSEHQTND